MLYDSYFKEAVAEDNVQNKIYIIGGIALVVIIMIAIIVSRGI